MMELRDKVITGVILIAALSIVYARISSGSIGGGAMEDRLTLEESRQMFEQLGGEAGAKPVTMFVTDWCPVCSGLEKELRTRGIRFIKADVEKNRDASLYYQKVMRGSSNSVPVTVVGSDIVLGYNATAIAYSYAKM